MCVRRKGRLGRLEGVATDFNHCGIGILLDQPLPKDSKVTVSLTTGSHHVDNVVGVVHNCISVENGYRCGIQFRTQSHLQMDRRETEAALSNLEQAFERLVVRLKERVTGT